MSDCDFSFDFSGSKVNWEKFIPELKKFVNHVKRLESKIDELTAENVAMKNQLKVAPLATLPSPADESPMNNLMSPQNIVDFNNGMEELCERVYVMECGLCTGGEVLLSGCGYVVDNVKLDPVVEHTIDENFGYAPGDWDIVSEKRKKLHENDTLWKPRRVVVPPLGATKLPTSASAETPRTIPPGRRTSTPSSYASVVAAKRIPKTIRGSQNLSGTNEEPRSELGKTLQCKRKPHSDFCVRGIPRLENSKFSSVKEYNDFIANQLNSEGIATRFVSVFVPPRGDKRTATFARIGIFKDDAEKILRPEIWPSNVFVREWVY